MKIKLEKEEIKNMFNPSMIMKIKNLKDKFVLNHPKFPMFLSAVYNQALVEDAVIEITVTRPDGQRLASNIKLKESDIEMLKEMQGLMK